MSSKDAITYGMFGINPALYYASKFATGRIDIASLNDVLAPEYYRFSFLRDEFNSLCPPMDRKLRVLDIGCGSGRFGGYLKAKRPDVELQAWSFRPHAKPTAVFTAMTISRSSAISKVSRSTMDSSIASYLWTSSATSSFATRSL